ncbi:MAG: flagella synthesis protein FlgN [Betaproteobacteria bacterium]|jgi:flagella synthesis protein FlgN|nr:flagellar protein FlgN [Betaproteobacteria bacterium]
MTAGNARHSLIDALEHERKAANDLLALLREEQHALVAGDADRVAAGLPAKAGLLARLAALGERRSALLQAQGIGATAAEQQLGADESELVLWRELRSATREAWRQNAINGALISERLLANQNALAAISPPGRCLYGRHGRSVSGWDSRELGAA